MEKIKLLYPNQDIRSLGDGWFSSAFEVDSNIIRVPKSSEAVSDYKKEEKILNFLNGKIKSVEIPNIKLVEEPFPYSIHKKLHGENWTAEEYEKFTEKEKDKLANDAAIFFMELHSIEINDELDLNKNLEVLEIEKYLSNEFTKKEIAKINNFIKPLYSLEDKCLLHTDFYYGNSLLNENKRLKCVFDFGNVCYSNYHFEFLDLLSSEAGEVDMLKRITKYYNKNIDIEIIKMMDIYNKIACCIYLAKNSKIKEEKMDNWNNKIKDVKFFIK